MSTAEQSPIQCATLTIPQVAILLGLNRTQAYVLAARDELPVGVIRMGKQLRVSRVALERLLEGERPSRGAEATIPASATARQIPRARTAKQ